MESGDDRDADHTGSADHESIEERRRELRQRERGLTDFADELDEREGRIEEREAELDERSERLDARADELDEREGRIEEREAELDDRRVAIEERERELSARADELDRKERTLEEYVDETIRDTVQTATAETMEGYRRSDRFGTIGSLVLALVGVTLIIAGVLHGFADGIAMVPTVFASEGANLGVTVLLLFSGLAANLTAVAD